MLLAYYPSEGLTTAEKNLARWQFHLACHREALKQGQVTVLALYPERPGQSATQLTAARRAYLRPLEARVSQYADLVRDAQQTQAGERALAYLAYAEQQTQARTRGNWLTSILGEVVGKLLQLLPSAVAAPPLAVA